MLRFDDRNSASVFIPFLFIVQFSVFRFVHRLAVLPSQLDEQSMQCASIFTHGVTRYVRAIVVMKYFEGQTVAKVERSRMGVWQAFGCSSLCTLAM